MRSSLAVLLCTLPLQDNRTNSRASSSFVSVAIGAELELQRRLDRSGDKIDGRRIYSGVRRTGNWYHYDGQHHVTARSVPTDRYRLTRKQKLTKYCCTTEMKYRSGE